MYLKSFRYGKNFELSGYSGSKGHAAQNISLGPKTNIKEVDDRSYSMLSKLSSRDKADSDSLRNLQLLYSFSQAKVSSLKAAGNIVTRLIELVTLDMNPITSDPVRKNDSKEFLELSPQQDDPAKDEYAFAGLKYGDNNRVPPHLGINLPCNGLKNTINPTSTDNHSWSSSNQYAATYFVVSFLHSKTTETRYSERVKQVTQQMRSSHDNNARSISQALIADTDNNISSTCDSALPPGGGFSTRTHLTLFSILQ